MSGASLMPSIRRGLVAAFRHCNGTPGLLRLRGNTASPWQLAASSRTRIHCGAILDGALRVPRSHTRHARRTSTASPDLAIRHGGHWKGGLRVLATAMRCSNRIFAKLASVRLPARATGVGSRRSFLRSALAHACRDGSQAGTLTADELRWGLCWHKKYATELLKRRVVAGIRVCLNGSQPRSPAPRKPVRCERYAGLRARPQHECRGGRLKRRYPGIWNMMCNRSME